MNSKDLREDFKNEHGFYPAITSRYIEWLESRLLTLQAQVESMQDTEADGVVFCGKCGGKK